MERCSASRLAPPGAAAEAGTPVMAANVGNTAGSPAASSRNLKILQQMITSPLVERVAVGALLRIATGAVRRLGGGWNAGDGREPRQHRRESFGLQS
ncbi:hypothetical protein DU490_05840 [Halomonas sp. DQ26W]|nr:hypothetical protein DU490_05840 [Halomonas sp. DQ26W]